MNKLVAELKEEHTFIIAKDAKDLLLDEVRDVIKGIVEQTRSQCENSKPPIKTVMLHNVITNASKVNKDIAESIQIDQMYSKNEDGKNTINSCLTLKLSDIKALKGNFRMADQAVAFLAIFADHFVRKRLREVYTVFSETKAKKISAVHVMNSKAYSASTDDEEDPPEPEELDKEPEVEEEEESEPEAEAEPEEEPEAMEVDEDEDDLPDPPSPEPVKKTKKTKITKTKDTVPKKTKKGVVAGKKAKVKKVAKKVSIEECLPDEAEPTKPKIKVKKARTKATATRTKKTNKKEEPKPASCGESAVSAGHDDMGYPTYPAFLSPPKA